MTPGLPAAFREEFVYLSLALEIEPEKGRACVAMRLSERGTSNEQPAIPPGDAGDSTFLVAPIEGKAQYVDIVGSGFADVGRGDLRDRSGERHGVVGLIIARACGWDGPGI